MRRLTYGNVTATLALCVALAGGGGYALADAGTEPDAAALSKRVDDLEANAKYQQDRGDQQDQRLNDLEHMVLELDSRDVYAAETDNGMAYSIQQLEDWQRCIVAARKTYVRKGKAHAVAVWKPTRQCRDLRNLLQLQPQGK
jgi:hypothetical protein